MKTQTMLTLAGVAELLTGAALLIVPTLITRLLVGTETAGVGTAVARVAGIALLSLGIGCCRNSVWLAMWLYTALVMLFLIYLAVATPWHGLLLWPVIAAHALLTLLLARWRT